MVGQVEFDHLLVRGQVIEFNISTTVYIDVYYPLLEFQLSVCCEKDQILSQFENL